MEESEGFTPTFDELAHELVGELGAIGRTLGPTALNSARGETAVLMSLFRSEHPLTPGELGRRACISTARVANILRTLEEKGMITRSHSSEDRRNVEVLLTADGRGRAREISASRIDYVARYLAALGERDAADLVRIARRSRDIVRELSEGAVER